SGSRLVLRLCIPPSLRASPFPAPLTRLAGIPLSGKREKRARPRLPDDAVCRDSSKLPLTHATPIATTCAHPASQDDCLPRRNSESRCRFEHDATSRAPSNSRGEFYLRAAEI